MFYSGKNSSSEIPRIMFEKNHSFEKQVKIFDWVEM
jgi:hypothetical protein